MTTDDDQLTADDVIDEPAPVESLLPYATVGLIQGSYAPAPYSPPPDDPGPFVRLGYGFQLHRQHWEGPVVASPSAIYFLKRARSGSLSVGRSIAVALTSPPDSTRSCSMPELPQSVRIQLDPKPRALAQDVIILRKNSVTYLGSGPTVGLIVMVGNERFVIDCSPFFYRRRTRILTEYGWVLDYAMAPTEPPVHGPGYGLPPQPVPIVKVGWVAYAVIGVLGAIYGAIIVFQMKHK